MEHAFDMRWRIPGRFSDYVILRGASAKAESIGTQVPQAIITSLLEGWLSSGSVRILHEIYESLGGCRPVGLNVLERTQYDQRLNKHLRDAFLWGKLVAVEIKHPLPRAWPVFPEKPQPKPPPPEPRPEPERTFIVIRLVDDEGNPVPGARYRVELPDGAIREGTLNSSGEARERYIVPGECKVTFPDFADTAWKPGSPSQEGNT